MKKMILFALAVLPVATVSAQKAAPAASSSPAPTVSNTTPATAADVESLREQVQSLTETVKALQQQVKDQQAALEKANLTGESGLPQNPEPSPIAGAKESPAPAGNAPPQFPTEDTSVVSSTTAPAASSVPGVSASPFPASGSFPTTDTSVITSTPETISSTGAGASLTQPITIGGGRNYMNISLDGLFALAYSSARDLDHIEVGDHDPQQRGFNARNIELAFDGAVDPYFQGFANIVFKLDNDNVFRALRQAEPNACAHVGFRRHASRQRLIFGARRVARRGSPRFLDVASAVVFAINLCVAKRTRQHRIFVPESW